MRDNYLIAYTIVYINTINMYSCFFNLNDGLVFEGNNLLITFSNY